MARNFDIKITVGTAPGPYTIYYDVIGPSNIATLTSNSQPATNISYSSLTTGNGVNVIVPDETTNLFLYNISCSNYNSYVIPSPSASPTPTLTPTITPTSSIPPTPSITATITPTSSITPTQTITPTKTVTPTVTATPTITPTITPTQVPILAVNFEATNVNYCSEPIHYTFDITTTQGYTVGTTYVEVQIPSGYTHGGYNYVYYDGQAVGGGIFGPPVTDWYDGCNGIMTGTSFGCTYGVIKLELYKEIGRGHYYTIGFDVTPNDYGALTVVGDAQYGAQTVLDTDTLTFNEPSLTTTVYPTNKYYYYDYDNDLVTGTTSSILEYCKESIMEVHITGNQTCTVGDTLIELTIPTGYTLPNDRAIFQYIKYDGNFIEYPVDAYYDEANGCDGRQTTNGCTLNTIKYTLHKPIGDGHTYTLGFVVKPQTWDSVTTTAIVTNLGVNFNGSYTFDLTPLTFDITQTGYGDSSDFTTCTGLTPQYSTLLTANERNPLDYNTEITIDVDVKLASGSTGRTYCDVTLKNIIDTNIYEFLGFEYVKYNDQLIGGEFLTIFGTDVSYWYQGCDGTSGGGNNTVGTLTCSGNTIEYLLHQKISATDNYTLGFRVRHKVYGEYNNTATVKYGNITTTDTLTYTIDAPVLTITKTILDLPIKDFTFRYLITIDSDRVNRLPFIVEDTLPNTIELGSYGNPYGLSYSGSPGSSITNLDWNQTTDHLKLQINDTLGIWYGSGTTISECGLQYDQFGNPIPNNTPTFPYITTEYDVLTELGPYASEYWGDYSQFSLTRNTFKFLFYATATEYGTYENCTTVTYSGDTFNITDTGCTTIDVAAYIGLSVNCVVGYLDPSGGTTIRGDINIDNAFTIPTGAYYSGTCLNSYDDVLYLFNANDPTNAYFEFRPDTDNYDAENPLTTHTTIYLDLFDSTGKKIATNLGSIFTNHITFYEQFPQCSALQGSVTTATNNNTLAVFANSVDIFKFNSTTGAFKYSITDYVGDTFNIGWTGNTDSSQLYLKVQVADSGNTLTTVYEYSAVNPFNPLDLPNATGLTLNAGESFVITANSTVSTTPYPTSSITPTRTITPTPSISLTPSIVATSSITPTPSITKTATITPTPSITATATITPTPSITATATITPTPSITATITPTPSITKTATITPTPSITATQTPTPTITATITPTSSITATATITPTPSITATITPTNSITPTPSVTATKTPTPSITATTTVTPTPSVTATQTPTPTITATITPTPSITATRTITPTPSITATQTPTPSITATITPTSSITPTMTMTPTTPIRQLLNVHFATTQTEACYGPYTFANLYWQGSSSSPQVNDVVYSQATISSTYWASVGYYSAGSDVYTVGANGVVTAIGICPTITATPTKTPTQTPTPSITPSSTSLPTYSVTPAFSNVNEGSSLTFNVNTTRIANGTTLYWSINTNGSSSPSDFGSTSGSFTINSNAGSFSVSLNADQVTEGAETFFVYVRTDSVSGSIVATSSTVTINDTSTYPAVSITYTVSCLGTTSNSGRIRFTSITGGNGGPYELSVDNGGTWTGWTGSVLQLDNVPDGGYNLKGRDNIGNVSSTYYEVINCYVTPSLSPTPTSSVTPTRTPTPTSSITPTPTMTRTPDAIVATITTVNASCYGYSDGSITVTNVSGGYGGTFQTKLNSGGTYTNWTSSTTYSNLPSGGYTIYVKDSAGREVTFGTAIGSNSAINLYAYSSSNSIIATAYGNSSYGKTFELYQDVSAPYNDNNGYMVSSTYVASGDPFTATFSNLGSGYYYVIVTEDYSGCFEIGTTIAI